MPKKRLSQNEKHELSNTKRRMNEQIKDKKESKKNNKQVEKRIIAHPKLLTLGVVKNGVENKFNFYEKKMQKAKKELAIAKETSDDKKINEAKVQYKALAKRTKAELAIMNIEVKQIQKLNKYSKGVVNVESKNNDIITINNLVKFYASKKMIFKALEVEKLSIKKGTFNVILGPSGSGKTTLLNMISGLDRATYGDVIVNDVNISALTTPQLTRFRRDKVGFVFQSYNLLSSLNVGDNIEVGRTLQTEPGKRKNVENLLSSIDMENNSKKRTYELSGGQQQRISIARALSKSPEILIGDEPTGALDQVTSLKVFELFQEINKKQNATVIIVTHNAKVAELADQVIHVRNGLVYKVQQNKNPKQAKNLKVL